MLELIKKHKYALIFPAYGILYLIIFAYLEKTVVSNYHIIHMWIDDLIPFCEYFIVPYLLWFIYMAVVIVYFSFSYKAKKEYYQLVTFLSVGMTIFLIVSYLYPNGHQLRPETFTRDNIFIDMVKQLYITDTSTNILPSIHVYNSIGVHIAIASNEKLSKNKLINIGSFILMILIIMSTVFLKQHSMLDVISGTLMAAVFYILIYKVDFAHVIARAKYQKQKKYI